MTLWSVCHQRGSQRLHKAMTLWFVRRRRGGQATLAWDSGTGKSLVLIDTRGLPKGALTARRGPHAE